MLIQNGDLSPDLVNYLLHEAKQFKDLALARGRKFVFRRRRDEWFQRDPWHDPNGARHHAHERFFHGYERSETVRMQH